jgi:hypothetical protein
MKTQDYLGELGAIDYVAQRPSWALTLVSSANGINHDRSALKPPLFPRVARSKFPLRRARPHAGRHQRGRWTTAARRKHARSHPPRYGILVVGKRLRGHLLCARRPRPVVAFSFSFDVMSRVGGAAQIR